MDLSTVQILISGPARSGKNTFGNMLADEFGDGVPFDIGTHLIQSLAHIRCGDSSDRERNDADYIARNKSQFRGDLIRLANFGRATDAAAFIVKGFKTLSPNKPAIVCGVRLQAELRAWVMGIRRPRAFLIEMVRTDATVDGGIDNFELAGCTERYLNYFGCTFAIENNSNLDELRATAKRVADFIRNAVK